MAEGHDVLVPHQRTASLQVGEQARATTGGKGEFHRGRLAVRLRRGLVEVGVAVQEQQSVATAAAQGEEVAEQDAAVPAEDHGKTTGVEDVADGVGQPGGVPGEGVRVEDPGAGVADRVVGRRFDPAGPHRAEAGRQSGVEQGRRQVLDSGGPQAEYGRRLDDRQFPHVRPFPSRSDRRLPTPSVPHPPARYHSCPDGRRCGRRAGSARATPLAGRSRNGPSVAESHPCVTEVAPR